MREIEFRAKGDDEETKDRWFYGGYCKLDDTTYCFKEDYDRHPENTKHYIMFAEMTDWGLPNRKLMATINPDTLGQFTGLRDVKGRKIYEGDIVKFKYGYHTKEIIASIKYGEWKQSKCDEYDCEHYGYYVDYKWENYCENTGLDLYEINEIVEVIGNIYDNPELLEEK